MYQAFFRRLLLATNFVSVLRGEFTLFSYPFSLRAYQLPPSVHTPNHYQHYCSIPTIIHRPPRLSFSSAGTSSFANRRRSCSLRAKFPLRGLASSAYSATTLRSRAVAPPQITKVRKHATLTTALRSKRCSRRFTLPSRKSNSRIRHRLLRTNYSGLHLLFFAHWPGLS